MPRRCRREADRRAGRPIQAIMNGFTAERLLVLFNPQVQRATDLAAEIKRWAGGSVPTLPVDDAAVRDLVAAHDLVVALGGDGTMLRAGRLTAPLPVHQFPPHRTAQGHHRLVHPLGPLRHLPSRMHPHQASFQSLGFHGPF